MSSEKVKNVAKPVDLEILKRDLYGHINLSTSFKAWMGFLTLLLGGCLFAYFIQLKNGLIVTGLRDYVSWGMYLSNFVFFVASSLIGMLISAVLGLVGIKWITPIARIAEIIAVAFSAVAGLVIVSDMGRPDRLLNVFIHGRFQSPILWDVTVITTYMVISVLLLFIPLIPDLAIGKKLDNLPKWLKKVYSILALNFIDSPEQRKIIASSIRTLLILIVPVALSIHTVTSWLFAVNSRPGWDSTIFGPYFVSGAFVAGSACVIIAMYVFRNSYKLKDYLTDFHFNQMGKLLVLVALVYLYFNINEYLVPAYKMQKAEAHHLHELFAGRYAVMFWLTQLGGLILPILLLLLPKMRKPKPIFVIALAVLLGAWFKRFIIVVPTMEGPFLPIQHVPHNYMFYSPTLIETAVTIAPIVMVVMIVSVLAKFLPIIPVYETAHENGIVTK